MPVPKLGRDVFPAVEYQPAFLSLFPISILERMFYNTNTEKSSRRGVRYMTLREKLLASIEQILAGLDDSQLRIVYQFVLHLTK